MLGGREGQQATGATSPTRTSVAATGQIAIWFRCHLLCSVAPRRRGLFYQCTSCHFYGDRLSAAGISAENVTLAGASTVDEMSVPSNHQQTAGETPAPGPGEGGGANGDRDTVDDIIERLLSVRGERALARCPPFSHLSKLDGFCWLLWRTILRVPVRISSLPLAAV